MGPKNFRMRRRSGRNRESPLTGILPGWQGVCAGRCGPEKADKPRRSLSSHVASTRGTHVWKTDASKDDRRQFTTGVSCCDHEIIHSFIHSAIHRLFHRHCGQAARLARLQKTGTQEHTSAPSSCLSSTARGNIGRQLLSRAPARLRANSFGLKTRLVQPIFPRAALRTRALRFT